MGIKKSELLTEVGGVPSAINPWVNFINLTILNVLENAKESYKEGNWQKTNMTIDGVKLKKISTVAYNIAPNAYNQFLNVAFGVSDHEELLKNKEFQKLPINNPKLRITYTMIPKNRWGDNPNDVMGNASFSMDESGRIVDGLIEGVKFEFDLFFKEGTLMDASFDKQITSFVKGTHGLAAHELTHAYQYYQETLTTGHGDKPNWYFGKESGLNWATQVMDGVSSSSDWNSFLKMVYWHLSFEVNARVTQLHYDMEIGGVKTTEEFKKFLKQSSIYQIANKLEKFNAEEFVKNFESPYQDFELERTELFSKEFFRLGLNPIRNWHELKLRMNKDKRNNFMLWSLIREWSRVINDFERITNKFYKGGNYPKMDPVPEKAKKDPMVFFKFFEDRFNKTGKEFKRKLHKLGSQVQDKERLIKRLTKEGFDKLVKEEIDDFGWADDINTNPFINGGVFLLIDRPITTEESEKIFQLMVDANRFDGDKVKMYSSNLKGYSEDKGAWMVTSGRKFFMASFNSRIGIDLANKFKEGSNEIIRVSELFGSLNESDEDDFKWVKDTEHDPYANTHFYNDDEMKSILEMFGYMVIEGSLEEIAINEGYRWLDGYGWYEREDIQDLPIVESEEDDFQWAKDTEQFDPRGKNIIIDFFNDPKWEGHISFKGKGIYQDVVEKLLELGYDANYLLKTNYNIGRIFLEDNQQMRNNEMKWDTGWDDEPDVDYDISEYEVMLATDFLNNF